MKSSEMGASEGRTCQVEVKTEAYQGLTPLAISTGPPGLCLR